MLLVVHNSHTDIYDADPFIFNVLNKELRYPTALAQYQESGIEVPGTEDGWDGWVRLLRICKTKPSWFPTGLLPLVQKIGDKFGYEVKVEDKREKPPESFPELVNIDLRHYQRKAVDRALEAGRGVLDMPPRCHAVGERILRADGRRVRVEDICVGDALLGVDGSPRYVQEIHTGEDYLYKIIPGKWAEPFTVNQNHLLVIKRNVRLWKRFEWREEVISVKDYLNKTLNWKRRTYIQFVPVIEYLGGKLELPLDPYFLGLLLGDGSIWGTPELTAIEPIIQQLALSYGKALGLQACRVSYPKNRTPKVIFSNGVAATKNNPNQLSSILKGLYLYGKRSGDKFIPDNYLRASVSARRALLAGLIDTDGYLANDTYFEYSTKSHKLAQGVCRLSGSLGLRSSLRSKYVNGIEYYRVNICGDTSSIPVQLPWKRSFHRGRDQDNRDAFTIDYVGRGNFVGFTVSDDNRYVDSQFIIHHNSGKTRTMTEIVRSVALPTIWIAPTDRIVQQTRGVLVDFFGKHYATHLVGAKNYKDAMDFSVVVCTAATAARLPQEFYDSRKCIVVDEFHHCLSSTTQVLTDIGERSISEIKVGDLVWSQGLIGCELKPVVNVWKYNSPKKMLRFHTTIGILEVTSEHQIYTEKGKKKAKDFRAGDVVYVREVRESNKAQGSLCSASKKLSGSRIRLSYLRQLRTKNTQKILWGTSYKLFGEKYFGRSRSTFKGNEKTQSKYGVQKISIRTYARGQKSIQTKRGTGKDKSQLEKYRQGTLWSRFRGEGGTSNYDRTTSSWGFTPIGIYKRTQNINGQEKRARRSYLVFSRFRSGTTEDSCRNRWIESQKPKRSRRYKRYFFSGSGMDSLSIASKIYKRVPKLVYGRIQKIENIKSPGNRVFDLEVEGNHNYIANGVLVSNSAAKSYKSIFDRCDHIYYRYGMTGTFFRSGEDILAMHALLSTTIYKVSSMELLRRGYLVPTYVAFVPVVAPLLRGVDSTFQKGHGKWGIQEHVGRNQLVSHCALELFKTGRRVLILVGTKKQGRLIRDILLAFVPRSPEKAEFKSVEFVSTDTDRPKQGRILESFESGQEVKVLIGTSLLGEGVDLPSTDALVYARGEQAQVGLTQSIYRVCTAVSRKKNAIVIDFADRHNRKLMIHSKERLRVYYNEETFAVSVLQDVKDLNKWLNDVLLLGG